MAKPFVETEYKHLKTGVLSGVIMTFVTLPFDRAIYFSSKNNIGVFNKNNYINPFNGLVQSIGGKILNYGFYFCMYEDLKLHNNMLISSFLTGAVSAIFNHPLSLMKSATWNESSKSLYVMGSTMIKKHSVAVLYRGIKYSILRDSLFSVLFFCLNDKYNQDKNLLKSSLIGTLACSITSPINYYRNAMFFNFNDKPTFITITSNLKQECNSINGLFNKIKYISFNKFVVGFSPIKVGTTISFSRLIYDYIYLHI